MSTDKEDIERIFSEALERPIGELGAFLAAACSGDPELRRRVEALLEAHQKSQGFLEDAEKVESFGLADSLRQALPSDEMPGDFIGRYKLLERLGEGGWGVVWLNNPSLFAGGWH